jgi:hypothetical protein
MFLKFVGITLVMTLANVAWADANFADAAAVKKSILTYTQISEGPVDWNSKINGKRESSLCVHGAVNLLPRGNTVTLMFGSQPLVAGISLNAGAENGKSTYVAKDSECTTTTVSDIGTRVLTADKTQECKDGTTTYHFVVTPTDRGLHYSYKRTEASGKVTAYECEYAYREKKD